ncbi:MAG: hypothetical protein WBV82_22390 [Myxococcaceae bacterium]
MKRQRIFSAIALVACGFVLLAPPAQATTLVHRDVPALTRDADTIVVGRVVKSESRWTADRRRIVTDVTVEVGESLKGAPGKTVVIRQPGGRVGDIGQRVDGVASFKQGEEVVVFLEQRPDRSFMLSGMSQGKFRVERSWDGKDVLAVPEPTGGARTVDPVTGKELEVERKPMPLLDLEDEVRRTLAQPAPEQVQPPLKKGTR